MVEPVPPPVIIPSLEGGYDGLGGDAENTHRLSSFLEGFLRRIIQTKSTAIHIHIQRVSANYSTFSSIS